MEDAKFSDLEGLTIHSIEGKVGSDRVVFHTSGGTYQMSHYQYCCEGVSVQDIAGDLDDLLGTAVLRAEESTSAENPPDYTPPTYGQDSFTWTFYRITTIKGTVVIRWYGESNGYYSESVDFEKVDDRVAQ